MAVTAAMVKELRESTGVGMVDCKNALTETDGNIEKAIDLLREKGLAAAAKKAGRIASEGLVFANILPDNSVGAVIEVNSETDFVAKNVEFKTYVENVSKQVLASKSNTLEELLNETWAEDTSLTVQEALNQKIAVIGENLSIRRFERFEKQDNGALVAYVHGAGKVVVLLDLVSDVVNDTLKEAGRNICMQIAAMSPKFVNRDEVPAEFIEKEKEILTQQAINEGKPANIVEKMIAGRLNKELKAKCLCDQEYVKDDNMSVSQYLESVSKEIGATISIARFVRFETGEGLEKKEENFADEVNKAIQG